MKNLKTNKLFQLGLTIFLIIAASILFFFLIFKIDIIWSHLIKIIKILTPFIIGTMIAYLLNPIVKFFKNKIFNKLLSKTKLKETEKISKFLSIFFTYIIILGLLIVSLVIVIPELLESIETIITNSPSYFTQIEKYLLGIIKNHPELEKIVLNNYEAIVTYSLNILNNNLLPQVEELIIMFSSGIYGAIKVIYNVVIGLIVSVYFLHDTENFKGQTKKTLYALFNKEKASNIIKTSKRANEVFGGFLKSKLLTSFLLLIITFIFLISFNIPYALLIAILIGVTNVIPYFGPFMGGIPGALLVLLHAPSKLWIVVLYLIVIQQVEGNIISPKLAGKKVGIKSFWVLFAIILFGGTFGIPGMIVGVPIFALIYGYIRNKLDQKLKKKKLPTETKEYIDF